MGDEGLKEFVNESREDLATNEADLLAAEEGGANIEGSPFSPFIQKSEGGHQDYP